MSKKINKKKETIYLESKNMYGIFRKDGLPVNKIIKAIDQKQRSH